MRKYSIILPVYNGEQYVAQAISSVLRQKLPDWELLIIDDGSSDGTGEICAQSAAGDPRIHYMRQENSGVSAARNRGIEAASGEYLLFLDADDWFTDDCLESFDSLLAANDVDLVAANYYNCSGENARKARPINAPKRYYGPEDADELISVTLRTGQWHDDTWYGLFRPVWGKCFRRDVIGNNGIRFVNGIKIGEDAVFLLEYLARRVKVLLADEYLYCYRENPGSVLHTRRWTDSSQGELYVSSAEAAAAGHGREEDLMQLWLEAAENDWKCIAYGDMSLGEKCGVLSQLCKTAYYRRFAGLKAGQLGGKKARAYAWMIRSHSGLGLLLLTYLKWKRVKLS